MKADEKSHDGRRNMNPADIGFWALAKEDFRTHGRGLFSQGFWAVFWHRFGNQRMSIRPRLLRAPVSAFYWMMFKLVELSCGISLPYTVILGRRVTLEHFGGMILIADRIGNDVTIRQNTTFGVPRVSEPQARPIICDGVDIGAGAVILGKIVIGEGAVVGANAVVVRDVPPNAVVGGVPARIIQDPAMNE